MDEGGGTASFIASTQKGFLVNFLSRHPSYKLIIIYMVLIVDGSSKCVVQTLGELGPLICSRHLLTST